ncbi:MAG TPA: M48 family metallopeptidase [Blastocatellia bacterium]|jgi:predicted Zn-dependent protease|nr:M48 family metallopeptidase [Blastocatellia bacterium]
MNFRRLIAHRFGSLALAVLVLSGSALAQTEKKAPKIKPLKDKENPLMIGKRDINKGSLNFYSIDKEVKMGQMLAAELERTAKFISDPIVEEYVNRVGQNVILRSDAKIPFTIKVLDSPEVNAFALPGGHLYVNTGLLLATDSEAELAGVIAHEISHVTARHGVEQASKGRLFQYLSIPLVFVGGPVGAIVQNAASILIPLSFLKFSRGAEEEADRLGLQYLWNAGYDPTAMLTFFEKLKQQNGKEPGKLAYVFSTHPPTGKRIVKARELMVRFPERAEYTVSTSEFNQVKEKVLALTNQKSLGDGSKGAPTLKRKPADDDGSQRDDSVKDPPTLKRKTGNDENQPDKSEKDPPTLKGKPGTTS